MLDAKFIRANPELVKAGARKKRIDCDVDGFLALDQERREVGTWVDEHRARQKSAGKAIAGASADTRPRLLEEQKERKTELKRLEERLAEIETRQKELWIRIPNVPAAEVPEGADDTENVELRRVGTPPAFDFESRDHVDLGVRQG